MPAAKQYVVLHAFAVRVDEETGAERRFASGDTYDGPAALLPALLAGMDFHGPLIAEKTGNPDKTDAAPPAEKKD